MTFALDEASTALLRSQAGSFEVVSTPLSPRARSCAWIQLPIVRVLLLRRLRLPLPLDAATCRGGAHLDTLGDHRAACPRAGLLRSRGTPLEHAGLQGTWRFCAISTSSRSLVSTMTGELKLSPTGFRSGEEESSWLSTQPLSRPSMQDAARGATSVALSARSRKQGVHLPGAHSCPEVPPRRSRYRGRRTLKCRGRPVRPVLVPDGDDATRTRHVGHTQSRANGGVRTQSQSTHEHGRTNRFPKQNKLYTLSPPVRWRRPLTTQLSIICSKSPATCAAS